MKAGDSYDDQVELLRAAFDQAPGFMALTRGPEHRFILANREYQRIAGVDPRGRTLAEALPALVAQGIGGMLDGVLATGQQYVARNMPVRMVSNGEWREIIVDFTSTLARRGPDGDDVLCVGHDVTERVRVEREALQLQSELTRVARTAAFGTMAATLAHELNQPLTASAAFLSGARRIVITFPGAADTEALEAIDLAEQEIQRAGEIIRQARNAVSQVLGERKSVSLAAMINDAIRLLKAAGLLDDIVIQISGEEAAVNVWVNEIQIEQVLINLFRNASEAMNAIDRKNLDVDISVEEGVAVCLIKDSGHGLLTEQDQFSSFTGKNGSLGLGLALSRTIVEAHGGRITIRNAPSGGALVRVSLPLAHPKGAGATEC